MFSIKQLARRFCGWLAHRRYWREVKRRREQERQLRAHNYRKEVKRWRGDM